MNVDYYNYYGNLRLAYALRMQQKFDVAVKITQKMLAIYPIDVHFLTEFALGKIGLGETDEAMAVFQHPRSRPRKRDGKKLSAAINKYV
ncbi:MAG: hypothetical protein R3C26_18120 [Calditrichia bacterium]